MDFEKLLVKNKYTVERFVHFRISDFEDAEDIIQETYITAFQKFSSIDSDDWIFDKYRQKWSEKLPSNEQIIVNNKVYVHWYDCISDYVL